MLLCMQRGMETLILILIKKMFVVGGMTTIPYFIAQQQLSALGSFRQAEIHKSLQPLSHFEIEHTIRRIAFRTQAI